MAYTFSQALDMVKSGTKMRRDGWPGKDQYIEYAQNIVYDPSVPVDYDQDVGNQAIAFHGMSGSVQLRWHASQADMLMDDWLEYSATSSVESA